jgi:DNA-binding CsgD family transcriptional regulator
MAIRRSTAPSKDNGRDLVGVPCAPLDLEAFSFRMDADEYVILTFHPEASLASSGSPEVLTDSEKRVVQLVTRGWSNSRVAAERGTSPRTIANQLTAVYRKLGVQSRRELIARARQPEPTYARGTLPEPR